MQYVYKMCIMLCKTYRRREEGEGSQERKNIFYEVVPILPITRDVLKMQVFQ